jgi:hypothetical protein
MHSVSANPTLSDAFVEECERLAVNARRDVGLWGYDPLPARRLATKLEIELLTPQQLGMSPEDVEQALNATRWSAITVLTSPYRIIYHPYADEIQFESNIMHELAHVLLKHKPELLGLISDLRVARKYPKRQELEADYLARCLQLPRLALQYARQKQMSVEQIAARFIIAPESVDARCSTQT